ncbi:spore coat protein [Salinicoccus sp. RF5]|uniref:spore coat protein n=1 Tax=Salinicoccus sp. RF5 TaxID=2748874 RepID=UPI001E3A5FDE|nr:spore coat protein [Salinicoccus sp. RF5]MCC4722409.1 spore coat protein [Salinicoccus sp. RF5]
MEFEDILDHAGKKRDELIATELLVSSKATVRAYAVALTETISPEVREILKRQLSQALNQHARIADYMIEREMYHPFDLDKQVKKDKKKVKKARKIIAEGEKPKQRSQKVKKRSRAEAAVADDAAPRLEDDASMSDAHETDRQPVESGSTRTE